MFCAVSLAGRLRVKACVHHARRAGSGIKRLSAAERPWFGGGVLASDKVISIWLEGK
jgi:hypothetical protein